MNHHKISENRKEILNHRLFHSKKLSLQSERSLKNTDTMKNISQTIFPKINKSIVLPKFKNKNFLYKKFLSREDKETASKSSIYNFNVFSQYSSKQEIFEKSKESKSSKETIIRQFDKNSPPSINKELNQEHMRTIKIKNL